MSVFVDPERLLVGLARTLRQRVRPSLTDASAGFTADAAIELALHGFHRRLRPVPLPDRREAEAMAAEVRRLTGRAVGGYSKQTLFINMLSGSRPPRQLVMRRDLPFAQSDRSSVVSEYPVLKALYERGLPIAEPLIIEPDPGILETPFLISQRVPGRLYGNSLGLTEKPDFDAEDLLGKLMADLHAIDPASLGISAFVDAGSSMEAQMAWIDSWVAIYRQAIDLPAAALEIGLAWLRANTHLVAGSRAIVHGDVGYHNILIHEGRPTALVDWEMVHLGSPVEDLAYVSSYIGEEEKLIERYVAHGGARPRPAAMAYARIFGDVRNAIYGVVAMAQYNRGVQDDVSALPIVLSSYSAYVGKLETMLAETIEAHGFIWRDA